MTTRTIAELVSHLKGLDVQLVVEGDRDAAFDELRLRCNAPEGTLTADLRQELANRKAELVAYLSEAEGQEGQTVTPGPTAADPERLPAMASAGPQPLSFAQQRLWFLYQLAPHNPFYNVPTAIRLTGRLNQPALERSLQEIVRRHAALRTTFTTLDGQPVQVVKPEVKVDFSVVSLPTGVVSESGSGESLRDRMSQQLATAEAQRPFNLTTDPLLRVTLLQFEPTEAVLLLTLHHIVADGWSLGVLIRELAVFYTAFVEGRVPELPPLPLQYIDFANWQRHWLQGAVLEQQLTYWRRQLQDLPGLELPSDRPRPAVQTYRGATHPLHLSPTLTQALEGLSQQSGVSLFMTLLAAFQTVLYRYTGQEDIAIGSPIANRHRSEVEGLIGFFVNSLVLRTDLSGNPTFRELLERVRTVALEAYEHQDLPFEKLVEELEPDRDLSRNPLFQVAFALQNAPMQTLELPELTLEPAPLESGSTRFDLEVHLWEPAHGLRSLWQSQAGLSGFIAYSTDLFERDRIRRLIGHFQTVLEGIVRHPDARLSELPLLTPAEQQQVLLTGNYRPRPGENQAPAAVPVVEDMGQAVGHSAPGRCFHHLFEAQVQQDPDAIALVTEQAALTYGELNQRADHLAQTLRQLGVQADTLVGLCVERSADMVIGILGILKAGGAYVPLDPAYPSDRLQFMVTDTQVAILLTQSWLVASLPASDAQVLCLDQPLPCHPEAPQLPSPAAPISSNLAPSEWAADSSPSGEPGDSHVTPDALAYVIYTSGSTGTPKGVLLTHRGLCNVVAAQQQVFHLSRNSRILQFSSLSFDASTFEIALALGCGGTLYLPPKAAQLPGMELIHFLQDNAITHALLTPAVLAVLPPADLPALQVLITGGEACSSSVVDRWAAHRHFFNAYGPTEATIWATVAELHPGEHPLTIGRPILNTQVYLLDANHNPVPAGIPGELYIGGAGLARGYLNRPELTRERFISVAFPELAPEAGGPPAPRLQPLLLYKTGDRAFYQPDGTIQFLGRVDHQVKIRGFRVELGEIEATLQRHPAVQDAAVMAVGESSSDRRLLAYFSLNGQPLPHSLLRSLHTQHLHHWQTLYNQTYHAPSTAPALAPRSEVFNITGWNSSYTGEPIPREQMHEWVCDRVQQILALRPKRVLEIGCGTGLLLFQIAPHCERYVGTDFSAVSLAAIQHQLEAHHLSHVELWHRMATEFGGIDPATFDVVILNSIVQYFPGVDYLLQVLESAVQVVAPGGVIFVGDVRSLPLLTAFHTWVQFGQADASMSRTQLQQRVMRSQFEEPELAIDPAFFETLRDRFPTIGQVYTRLSRGRSQNEMTQFRYNVLIHIDGEMGDRAAVSPTMSETHRDGELDASVLSSSMPLSNSIQHYDWEVYPVTVAAIQQQLIETEPEMVVITNVTNRRVNAAVKLVNWVRNQDWPKTVGRMRELVQNTPEPAIDPQDWWELETGLPYRVEIAWSSQTHTGDYDVLCIRQGVDPAAERFQCRWQDLRQIPVIRAVVLSASKDAASDCSQDGCAVGESIHVAHYTNNPLQSSLARHLIPEFRQHLRQALPDYMVPAAFVPLETLPLTPSGKVDRRCLPIPDEALTQAASPTSTAATPTETTLMEIWQDLLRLKQVTVNDNFFELGGHSLLATQLTSRIRDAFELELPLKSVFEAPTIAQLVPLLDTLRGTSTQPNVPPLVRLDRAAHRRRREAPQGTVAAQPSARHPDHIPETPDQHAWSPLIPLTLGDSQQPFFCVHPMFGVVFPYLELAHHLDSHRSFYGLQPLGLDGKSAPLNRIEAIAAYYIQAIQTLQPHGPYCLGGWSFGGLVAFEMAQQLTQAGEAVELLAILDTTAPANRLSICQSLKFLLGTAVWSTLPFLLDYGTLAANRLQARNSWFSRWQWSAIAHLVPEESRLRLFDESAVSPMLQIVYAHSQAAYRYQPQPYPHRITLFRAADQPDGAADRTLGWNLLGQDVHVHQVPGNHLSLLQQPHVQILAQQLGQCLAAGR